MMSAETAIRLKWGRVQQMATIIATDDPVLVLVQDLEPRTVDLDDVE